MLEITLLPARQGDAIWVRWGDRDKPHQILIDMGTEEIGDRIRERILALPEDRRVFDLLVVSHVDRDHIGGVLTCLAEADEIPGLEVGDVWFNGFQHLNGQSVQPGLEPMGPAQGERLSTWLRQQVWNDHFDGKPVQRVPGEDPPKESFHDNLTLTVLGPTPERLEEFIPKWKDDVEEALEKGRLVDVSPGLEPMGPKVPPILAEPDDLEILAETHTTNDTSEANGSSISLLLEYKGRKVVLSGDAFPDDLIDGVDAVSANQRLHLDAFKLPHHGSKKNISKELVESVDCDRWLFSTDGTQFRHPDPVALARVISYSTVKPPRVYFNVPSKYNGWWKNDHWKHTFGYCTDYGTAEDGLTLELEVGDA